MEDNGQAVPLHSLHATGLVPCLANILGSGMDIVPEEGVECVELFGKGSLSCVLRDGLGTTRLAQSLAFGEREASEWMEVRTD